MHFFYLCRGIALTCVLFALSASSAWSAGLWLYEQATPDSGTASAGRAALAQDASTVGQNPAGMTRLDRSQLLAGFQGIFVSAEFDPGSATSVSGGDGGDAGGFVPAASFAYVHNLTPRWKIGVMAGSYFGLGLDYDNDWSGRYFVQEAELMTAGFNPAVAYRVNSWLSVGAGVTILYGDLTQEVAVNNLLPSQPDGRIRLEEDDFGYGGNLGILVEPWQGTRFGFTYRSEIDLEFQDVATLEGVLPPLSTLLDINDLTGAKVAFEMTMPQAIMLSAYHQINDVWAIMGNIGWQEWSEFGKTSISIKSSTETNLTDDRNFDDTWHFAVGAQYRHNVSWLFSLGFAYDESSVDDRDRTPDMPLDQQLRYSAGIQYDLNEDVSVGGTYTYLDAGDAKIDQSKPLAGDLKGDYETNHIHFLAINLIKRF